MFALARVAFPAIVSPSIARGPPIWGLEACRLFSSSRTIFKFYRPQPTDAELREMNPGVRWYYKNRHDPAVRQRYCETTQLRYVKLKQKRLEDPEFEKSENARWRVYNRKHGVKQRVPSMFRRLLRRMPESQKDAYDWKSHRPIVMSEPRPMTCDVCLTHVTRGTLWWERIDHQSASGTSDAKQYTCHSCYMHQDPDKILPRGCESYVLGSGKRFPKP